MINYLAVFNVPHTLTVEYNSKRVISKMVISRRVAHETQTDSL